MFHQALLNSTVKMYSPSPVSSLNVAFRTPGIGSRSGYMHSPQRSVFIRVQRGVESDQNFITPAIQLLGGGIIPFLQMGEESTSAWRACPVSSHGGAGTKDKGHEDE
jgi:hypothetical protein